MYSDELKTYGVCPVYDVLRFEHYSPRGRMAIARALLEERIKYTEGLANVVYTCLGCMHCRECCWVLPEGLDMPAIMLAMRQDIVDEGVGPPEPLKIIDVNIEKERNPFGEPLTKRAVWSEGLKLSEKEDILYFAGCYASYRYPEIAKSVVKILEKAGITVTYLKTNEWCCGIPYIYNGQITRAEEMAKHNVSVIEASGAETVVTACAGCYAALKLHYPDMMGKLPFDVVHFSEVLSELINTGKVRLTESFPKKITYHDPCHLGRYAKVYEPPRQIIRSIPGVHFVEMLRNKEHAWCCGGGTIVGVAFPELTKKIARARIAEAKDVEAEILVTACPFCVSNLSPAARIEKIEVYDLPVFIAKYLKLRF
jgi:heterodisulfide reductase subunit D